MTDKTVVIGVGAQKAGTSWLHYFLKHHPQCAMSPVKEVHYFDSIEMQRKDFMTKSVERVYNNIFAHRSKTAELVVPQTVEQALKHFEAWSDLMGHEAVDLEAYLEYLLMSSGDAKVIGEVTPAYAMLSADSFRAMNRVAAKTKFVYLMRDPVSRLWSNLRMRAKKRAQTPEDLLEAALTDLAKVLGGGIKGIAWRSDYKACIETMTDVLPREDIHFDFFEDLFDGGGARVCTFLGIDEVDAYGEKNVNEGVKVDLPHETGRIMLDWLKPQYEFVRDTFGKLPAKWDQTLEVYA